MIVTTLRSESKETTDPARYLDSLHSWPFYQVKHFPGAIPSNSNPSFYHNLPWFQGSDRIYLEVDRSDDEVAKLKKKAEDRSVYVVRWTEGGDDRIVLKNEMGQDGKDYPSPNFFGKTGELTSRENYVAYYYGAERYGNEGPSKPGDWKHGHIYGIAFHRQRGRVAYWAKEW